MDHLMETNCESFLLFIDTGDREINTEGKMLLVGLENGSLQGFGLRSREQVSQTKTLL